MAAGGSPCGPLRAFPTDRRAPDARPGAPVGDPVASRVGTGSMRAQLPSPPALATVLAIDLEGDSLALPAPAFASIRAAERSAAAAERSWRWQPLVCSEGSANDQGCVAQLRSAQLPGPRLSRCNRAVS